MLKDVASNSKLGAVLFYSSVSASHMQEGNLICAARRSMFVDGDQPKKEQWKTCSSRVFNNMKVREKRRKTETKSASTERYLCRQK